MAEEDRDQGMGAWHQTDSVEEFLAELDEPFKPGPWKPTVGTYRLRGTEGEANDGR